MVWNPANASLPKETRRPKPASFAANSQEIISHAFPASNGTICRMIFLICIPNPVSWTCAGFTRTLVMEFWWCCRNALQRLLWILRRLPDVPRSGPFWAFGHSSEAPAERGKHRQLQKVDFRVLVHCGGNSERCGHPFGKLPLHFRVFGSLMSGFRQGKSLVVGLRGSQNRKSFPFGY